MPDDVHPAVPDAPVPDERAAPTTTSGDAGSVSPAQALAIPASLRAELQEAPEPLPAQTRDPAGTVPAVSARRQWAKQQALNWRIYLIRFLTAGLSVVLTVLLLPGLRFAGWRWGEFLTIAIAFGLLNMLVKPLLQFLSLRFIFNTYGLVVVLINSLLLLLLGLLMPDRFQVERPIALLGGGLLVGLLGLILETVLGANPPILDRDYKERNGLA
ncbi:MAG TPA: phage holin family protein [Candidatus Nanopelagicales bacterium]